MKAAASLSPDGSLAVFGHVPVGMPAALVAKFRGEIYLRHTGKWGLPPEAWYLPNGPFKPLVERIGLFGPVEHRGYSWKWRHTTSSYANFLRTKSELQTQELAKREAMLGEIGRAIDDQGRTSTPLL